ncbi:T9SS type A sorting domain-containing protein [Tamlana flava]|uniref:T9SS type A sorting domain-containing protein n=1 Tax=Tamlana flava TaxID=3158572 RepID=UPI00351ABBA8
MDFDGLNGSNPQSGGFTDISSVLTVNDIKSQLSFLLYPNPTKEKVTIKVNSSAYYSLVSILGQEIKNGVFSTGNNELNLSNLSKGFYLLNITTNERTASKKIIKE